MLNVSDATKNALSQSTTISMINGCWIEYNMNDLISGVTVRGPGGTADNPAGSLTYTNVNGEKPFDKLFPITSIIDPRRPKSAGIQYLILGDPTLTKRQKEGILNAANYNSSKTFANRLYYPGIKTAYKYWVSPVASGTSLSNCTLTVAYPKLNNITPATNKITIKFETSHGTPTSWNLTLINSAGTEQVIYTGTSIPDSNKGVVNLFFNGTAWTTNEFTTPTSGVDLTGLKLNVTSISEANGYLGIIEIAAKYVIDVSDRVVSFGISKSSSDAPNGLIPVGDVTANSLTLSLNGYDKNYAYYDKTIAFDKTKINLYNNTKIKPFVTVGSEKINLGIFYTADFSVSEFGDIQITALDGARELQYIKAPEMVCKEMSSLAIIRRLLDGIGFTNYNFNLASTDTSSISPLYWYTDNTKTVWQHIQDICKDTQMIATFDENDILQFYPRDYIFANKDTQYKFRYNASESNLANISSLTLENVPTVKSVKVVYSPQLSSAYLASAQPIYRSPVSILGAGALMYSLPAVAPSDTNSSGQVSANGVVWLEPVSIDGNDKFIYSFSGYLVLDQEIIEFDAVEYDYIELATATYSQSINKWVGPSKAIWITSDSDVSKYQGLSAPNTFSPNGRYRIKTRNAFGVVPPDKSASLNHIVNTDDLTKEWQGKKWNSVAGTFTDSEYVFQLTNMVPNQINNLLNSVSRSFMTITAPNSIPVPNVDPAKPDSYIFNTVYSMATIDANYTGQKNFIIGTNLYFPLVVNPANRQATGEQRALAGIAFSLSSDNSSGYFMTMGTSQNSNGEKNYKDINFYKLVNGKPVSMITSQKDTDGTIITNINGGELYRVDIKVTDQTINGVASRIFKIMVNNKMFSVVDNKPISLTNKIGLVSLQGISSFDYVYTSAITDYQFVTNNYFDVYNGFLGQGSALIKNFSDFIFIKGKDTSYPVWVREFGPVARELRRIKSKYSSAPAFPRYPILVQNPNVTIVGSTLDSYNMDIFVMNSSGAFTPLDNGAEKVFSVVGDYVGPSDPYEYMDPNLTDADKAEQVGFDSVWIQKESEAKSLAQWITNQWSHQQKVLTIDAFINPILQIGDVVEVSYPSNSLYSSEDVGATSIGKYVILALDTTYDQNSTTTQVVCRSIYTG